MNPIPASSQNNQNNGKNNLIPRPVNASENIGGQGEDFNIKVPPQGIIDSLKTDFNSDSAPRSDKNIKYGGSAESLLKPDFQSGQSSQNNSLPAQARNNDYKNTDQYKLSNGEVQGLKPPLTANNGYKIIFAAIAVAAIGALAIGGYFLTQKSGDNIPADGVSPAPAFEPATNTNLDSDLDAITDIVEKAIGTNPDKMDTDGDSYNDLAEIKNGYSPLIAGAAGKYTPEQWQTLKDKIKAADEGFYEKEFGAEKEPKVNNGTKE